MYPGCSVYTNTQIHLIKDTIISFGLSLLYPLGICLLPGIFRLPALRTPKKIKNVYINLAKSSNNIKYEFVIY